MANKRNKYILGPDGVVIPCPHAKKRVFGDGIIRCQVCHKSLGHMPTRDVLGDLDGVRECYGHFKSKKSVACEECPIVNTCRTLSEMCGM